MELTAAAGLAFSTLALTLSLYSLYATRRRDRRDQFIRLHEALLQPDLQRGRRLIWRLGLQASTPAEWLTMWNASSEEDRDEANRALSYLDLVGMYAVKEYVEADDAYDIWGATASRAVDNARPYLDHRQDRGSKRWLYLDSFATEARRRDPSLSKAPSTEESEP